MLPKTSAYVKDYDKKTNSIYFLIKDNDLLNKYNTMWDKISADAKIELNDEPVYNKTFLKSKVKFYGDEATDFHDKKVPKVDSSYTCLTVISLDSNFGVYEKYYPQVLLKNASILKKVIRYIADDFQNSSDNSGEE